MTSDNLIFWHKIHQGLGSCGIGTNSSKLHNLKCLSLYGHPPRHNT
uniref:Uncharacterized protein n=1 Tax=Anguilla anguilla TaxID=7936 RepID=A0A0E9WLN3_ANGAN